MRLREFDDVLKEGEGGRLLSRRWEERGFGSFELKEEGERVLNEIRGGLRLEGSEALR